MEGSQVVWRKGEAVRAVRAVLLVVVWCHDLNRMQKR